VAAPCLPDELGDGGISALRSHQELIKHFVLFLSHEDLRSLLLTDHRSLYLGVVVDSLVLSSVPLWFLVMRHGGRQNCWGENFPEEGPTTIETKTQESKEH
jgi:hypothetical protein